MIGCGDAFGAGGRAQSATLIEGSGGTVLLDCGASTISALNKHGVDPSRIEAVVLTHLHGDHFGGLPFLIMDGHWTRGRTHALRILGPEGTRRRLLDALDVFFPDAVASTPWSFAWDVEEIAPGDQLAVAGFAVTTTPVHHQSGAPAMAVRLESDGAAFVHSGDTEWLDELPAIAGRCDLLFLECTAWDAPIPGHIAYATLALKGPLFQARHIVLTHLGPDVLAHLDRIDRTRFDIAEDGRVFTL